MAFFCSSGVPGRLDALLAKSLTEVENIGFMFWKSSTEPNFKLHVSRLEMQALYKRRENLSFAVVNRATTIPSETPLGL
jgi:hypothetical protein